MKDKIIIKLTNPDAVKKLAKLRSSNISVSDIIIKSIMQQKIPENLNNTKI